MESLVEKVYMIDEVALLAHRVRLYTLLAMRTGGQQCLQVVLVTHELAIVRLVEHLAQHLATAPGASKALAMIVALADRRLLVGDRLLAHATLVQRLQVARLARHLALVHVHRRLLQALGALRALEAIEMIVLLAKTYQLIIDGLLARRALIACLQRILCVQLAQLGHGWWRFAQGGWHS